MANPEIKTLCGFHPHQGCASKLRKNFLKEIVHFLPDYKKKNKAKIISAYDSFDDAAIYEINDDTSIIFSIDFITPVTNNPEKFGEIAVANSLSDIYAKGASPSVALNVLGFPQGKIDLSVVERVIQAGYKKAERSRVFIIGGHTLNISEFIYGLAVVAFVKNNEFILNSTAREGDALILTKPLGTNVVLTLLNKAGYHIDPGIINECLDLMSQVNAIPSILMKEAGANACVDITGYGLIGHLSQMLEASNQKALIYARKIPTLRRTLELMDTAYRFCSIEVNKADYADSVEFSRDVPEHLCDLLFDAHTSGGLLISVPKEKSGMLLKKLHSKKIAYASIIGEVVGVKKQRSRIVVE